LDDNPEAELAVVSRRIRERLAKEGKALKDGSYPIRNVADLKNAIQAYGRAKEGKRALVKKHIMRRARGLERADLIPDKWKEAALIDYLGESEEFFENSEAVFQKSPVEDAIDVEGLTDEEIDQLKKEVKAEKKVDEATRAKYTPDTQPRDSAGKFRQILARIKFDAGISGLDRVLEKVEETENFDSAGNYAGAAKAAGDLISIIDRLDEKALNPDSLENVRSSAGELGKVIANLPFAFGEDAQKIRFSDVPPALRDLIEDMITRVEAKIGQEDADIATADLKKFMSGSDLFNQSEISSEMSKLLRLLT
jgi:ribosomal protein S13